MRPGAQRRQRARAAVAVLVAGAVAGTAAILLLARVDSPVASTSATPARAVQPHATIDAVALPDPVEPAFTPPQPRALAASATAAVWAPVVRAAAARARPDDGSPLVTTIPTRTPEGTDNIVLVLRRERDAGGRLWVQVRIPALPDNVDVWVERSALGGYTAVQTRLEVDLRRLTATLYRGGRRVFEAPVGVGRAAWPTPTGHFYVRNKLTHFASPVYGPLAFGTSARSSVLTDWPDGGYIGIHGTNRPELLPGRVSHGCIRLRNDDIRRLARLMPVGTPVTIT